jgi:glycolate oxidase FAD binding subunit
VVTSLQEAPQSYEEAAAALADAAAKGRAVRIVGGGTKLGWGRPVDPASSELHTSGLDRILAHNVGDLTASLQAGVPLAEAQRVFAAEGQMLALDPPLGGRPGATIGGILASGDSGPLRHRYGAPRDLVVGVTVALSDGTIAHSGGTVIKNVAGYDLAKLFTGSFGTLGLILSVNVRLHPVHAATSALGAGGDPDVVAAAAAALAAAPLELEALDVGWRHGRGGLLARCAGGQAARRAQRAARLMGELGLDQVDVTTDDAPLWERQRAGQRSPDRALVRLAAPPSALAGVLRAAESCAGTVVGRAALGCSYVELDPGAVAALRACVPPGTVATLLDAPAELRGRDDPWGVNDRSALALMHRVKERFDPAGVCNSGLFVDGI